MKGELGDLQWIQISKVQQIDQNDLQRRKFHHIFAAKKVQRYEKENFRYSNYGMFCN